MPASSPVWILNQIEIDSGIPNRFRQIASRSNVLSIGAPTKRWSVVYAATGVINTSDERQKTDIVECPLGLDFLAVLTRAPTAGRTTAATCGWSRTRLSSEETVDGRPRRAGPPRAVALRRAGRRLHLGLMAQDVKAALDVAGVDCGLWVRDDPADSESVQSLRYDQFVAPLIQAVKELRARLVALETAARPVP